MNIFDNNSGDFKMGDSKEFFKEVRKTAMDSGYSLFVKYGIDGMREELGSKDPIGLANKLMTFFIDKVEDILYQAHSEGIWKEVLDTSKSLENSNRHFYDYGDKLEAAYNIVKNKNYENKHLDKEGRSTKR